MIVAGLDLSLTAAGVAVIDGDVVSCYTFGYGLTRAASERDRIERVIFIVNQVMGVLLKHRARYVGIENYGFAGHNLTMQADLGGSLKTQIYVGLKTVPIIISCMSVRKYLLGKATKDKKIVRKNLLDRGFDQPKNFDEADALAVALVVNDWANCRETIVDVEKMDLINRIDFHQSVTIKKEEK